MADIGGGPCAVRFPDHSSYHVQYTVARSAATLTARQALDGRVRVRYSPADPPSLEPQTQWIDAPGPGRLLIGRLGCVINSGSSQDVSCRWRRDRADESCHVRV